MSRSSSVPQERYTAHPQPIVVAYRPQIQGALVTHAVSLEAPGTESRLCDSIGPVHERNLAADDPSSRRFTVRAPGSHSLELRSSSTQLRSLLPASCRKPFCEGGCRTHCHHHAQSSLHPSALGNQQPPYENTISLQLLHKSKLDESGGVRATSLPFGNNRPKTKFLDICCRRSNSDERAAA